MLNRMRDARSEIKPFLSRFLAEQSDEYQYTGRWSKDLCTRLDDFMERAKMLRGGMVLVGHDVLQGDNREAALMTAAAMELIHSAFLIHDDIMDRDRLRRGAQTIYHQYELLGEDNKYSQPHTFGQAMGICAGDEAFFLAYELLISLPVSCDLLKRILKRINHEMKRVGLAQMGDVEFGHTHQNPSINEILQVYRYKTAFYTFSLPLYLGAVLAGCTGEDLRILEKIGENLGIIFQLKDDDLGVFGDEDTIGKPSGSDIREDKKTLFRHFLRESADAEERILVDSIFGKEDLTEQDVDTIRSVSEKLGVRKKISDMIDSLANDIRVNVDILSEVRALKPLIVELLEYSLIRTF